MYIYYQGINYMYQGKWYKAINSFINYLKLNEYDKEKRSQAMIYIAKSYKYLNRYEDAKKWLNKAIKEAPFLKEPYIEMALYYANQEDWHKVIYYCNKAKRINEFETIDDLLKLAKKYKKHY